MELMPLTSSATTTARIVAPDALLGACIGEPRVEWTDWRAIVPALINDKTRLRELRVGDAPSLLSMLSTEEVSRFISPPPTTLQGYEQFIRWSHRKREDGQYICLGVVPEGYDVAIGIFQLQIPSDATPEGGFALGSPFWGTGLFLEGAEAVIDFAFRGIGLPQLGARAVVENGRGNGALRKVGAVCEGIIPGGLVKNGRPLDQFYWTVSPDARVRRKVIWEPRAH